MSEEIDKAVAKMDVVKGDIVQADPGATEWGPSLVVVDEVKSWGIQGYTHIPRSGDAYIRLQWNEFERTGGKVVWDTP